MRRSREKESERLSRVYELVRTRASTYNDLERELGWHNRTIGRYLRILVQQGKIRKLPDLDDMRRTIYEVIA